MDEENNPYPKYGSTVASGVGSQMYGYAAAYFDQQGLPNEPTKDSVMNQESWADDMDGYLESLDTSTGDENTVSQATQQSPSIVKGFSGKPLTLQEKLTALATNQGGADEASGEPMLNKVIKQTLDPSMFQPKKKSRFDQAPPGMRGAAATGANATPLGQAGPTIVLNKYSISSSSKLKPGMKRKSGGKAAIPANTCTVDIKMQVAIMQEVAKMRDFKFTIGINKLYKDIFRKQKNKRKNDPMIIEQDFDRESLLEHCEAMSHLVRVKNQKYIKMQIHVAPYLQIGVNLWSMFHGKGTRRIIRDNWLFWIGPKVTPEKLGLPWTMYFQMVRNLYFTCDKRQRSKFRSKYKGIENYVIQNTMWAPNKCVKFEKLWKELKCAFAIKKHAQSLVDWKKVIKFVMGQIPYLHTEPGNFVGFKPRLRQLLTGIEPFVDPKVGTITLANLDQFESDVREYCMKHGGYDWSEFEISFRRLIKLYNCVNTTIHRPDPFSNKQDARVAFAKQFRTGFKELVLPIQENRLGDPTIPALVRKEVLKLQRHEEKKSQRILELKREAAVKAELKERERLQKAKLEANKLPSNDDMFFKIAGVQKLDMEELDGEELPPTYSDIEVSEDEFEDFSEAIYTYSQYLQPIAGDTLYPIPGGTKLEDEIKLRVENQDSTPGLGYGLALTGPKGSVLFTFYPWGRTMRCAHFSKEKHHHKVYADFRAGKLDLFQLTVKIKRNRFEVFTDSLLIKTVPAYMNTVGITSAMTTGTPIPFVNFRVRRRSPEVPLLPYLVRRRHQTGLLVKVTRHSELGIITKIGKILGNMEMFVSHLTDVLASENEDLQDELPAPSLPNPLLSEITALSSEQISVITPKEMAAISADFIPIQDNVPKPEPVSPIGPNSEPASGVLGQRRVVKKLAPKISVRDGRCVWVTGHHKGTIAAWLKCIGF